MYKLICMSFDGEYITETREPVATIDDAWEVSNNLGSKWFFYPFHFVVTESGKSIADAPVKLGRFRGLRVKTMAKEFKQFSELPEAANIDPDEFVDLMYYA